jgi:hypothetical protein
MSAGASAGGLHGLATCVLLGQQQAAGLKQLVNSVLFYMSWLPLPQNCA